MHVLELHKIQSFPVSCLNRDDVGAPKNCHFGGVERSRISSQCFKRAMREHWKDAKLPQFAGVRTKRVKDDFEAALSGLGQEKAALYTQSIMTALGGADKKKGKEHKLATLIFISPMEIKRVAEAVAKCENEKGVGKAVTDAMKGLLPKDAVDVALFGRMFADSHDLSVDACCMIAHPISTHKHTNEFDFFTAMDENKPLTYENEADDEGRGAGMMDSAGFASATFYHYAALNLDMLKAKLSGNTTDELRFIVRAFTDAFALTIPSARQTTHNAHTRPGFVMATIQTGQPFQLCNAFEAPVRANGNGYVEPSTDRLIGYLKAQKATWDLSYDLEVTTPPHTFAALLDKVASHV